MSEFGLNGYNKLLKVSDYKLSVSCEVDTEIFMKMYNVLRKLQNSIWGQICPFSAGFGFLANRLWPIGYVDLQEIKPALKSSYLARKASYATPSINFYETKNDRKDVGSSLAQGRWMTR